MIISRTPFRVSLFGGGSDYPQWYEKYGGTVLGFAINKYCYITLRPLPQFFEHRHRIVYSKIETVKELSEIEHPAVRNILQTLKVDYGVEIHHDGDLPARSGLGSSSSFTVGLLNALYAQKGVMRSKDQLAREAINIEQNVIAENVGSQDQVWAAHGGLNRIDFHQDGSIDVIGLVMEKGRRQALMDRLLLCFTGLSRFATEMAAKKIANLDKQATNLCTMMGMVDEAQAILANPNRELSELGKLLHESWLLKRGLSDVVTNDAIDKIYEAGRSAGALGGKLLGAGSGGFMLFYVEPEYRQAVVEKLHNLVKVDINVDTAGSKIVVYEPHGV
jgi:D-glycero-alpha-D-manno-heptose-7-phosphate kinase